MWIGLLHLTEADDGVDEDTAIVVAYEDHRLWSFGVPADAASQYIALLREAADHGRRLRGPRCGDCGEPLTVPPLDDVEAECASA